MKMFEQFVNEMIIGKSIRKEKLPDTKNSIQNITFSEEKNSEDINHGSKTIEMLKDDEIIGRIQYDYKSNSIKIKWIYIKNQYNNQNLGILFYKHLIEFAKSKGLSEIESDNIVQGGAISTWIKLKKQGYNLVVNPNVKDEYEEFFKKYQNREYFDKELNSNSKDGVFKIIL